MNYDLSNLALIMAGVWLVCLGCSIAYYGKR